MNYYNEIKEQLINNEVYKKAKEYSKNRSDLKTYYNVGKLLSKAGKRYGEAILKQYSNKLTKELGKGICAKDNKIILEYSSDPRIYETSYILN